MVHHWGKMTNKTGGKMTGVAILPHRLITQSDHKVNIRPMTEVYFSFCLSFLFHKFHFFFDFNVYDVIMCNK